MSWKQNISHSFFKAHHRDLMAGRLTTVNWRNMVETPRPYPSLSWMIGLQLRSVSGTTHWDWTPLWSRLTIVRNQFQTEFLEVSWPIGLGSGLKFCNLHECGFESWPGQLWHLYPWAGYFIIIASLHPGVQNNGNPRELGSNLVMDWQPVQGGI